MKFCFGFCNLTGFSDRQLKPDEVTGIMKDFDEPGHLAPTGLHIDGAKYMVIQGEPNAVIRGKKVNSFHVSLLLDMQMIDF